MFKRFVKLLVDKKEVIGAGVIGFITLLGAIVLGGCVAGDAAVKEILSCVNNICTIKQH